MTPLGAAEMDTVRLPISIFALAESGVFCTSQKGTMSYFSLFGSAAYSAALGTSIFAGFANPINFPPEMGCFNPAMPMSALLFASEPSWTTVTL